VYICKKLVDVAVAVFSDSTSIETVWKWFLMMAGVVLLRILLNAWRSYVQTKTEIRLKNGLRTHLFDVLLRLQSDGSRRYHSGDVLNRVQEDVRVVSTAVAAYIPNFIGAILQFSAALAFLLYLDIRLALVLVIVLPVGMLVGKFITRRIRNLTLDIRNKDSKVQSHLQESIQHVTLLQTLEYEETSAGELNDLQNELYSSELRRARFTVISRIFVSLTFQTGYAVAFMWGVLGISHGTVTYGMMTAFLQLVGQIQRPLLDMSTQLPALIHSTASIDRIIELESQPCEDYAEPVKLSGVAGISIEDVSFSYP
jgi:ABC-type multidrug transport system fused ATPase/permease subunit